MKKLLFAVGVVALALVLLAQQDVLWSRLQFLEAPRVYLVQKGESLSKLAQEHYGNTDYWRELALVNRAPEPDYIQPGEEILLPAANVIHELRRARTISRVNDLVNAQHALATRVAPANTQAEAQTAAATNTTSGQPAEQPETIAMAENPSETVVPPASAPLETAQNGAHAYDNEPAVEESGGSWFWVIFGLLALGGVVGFVVYRRRQEEQDAPLAPNDALKANGDARNFQMDRRPQGASKVERIAM
jgi:nucleoid-associated protein YgaU